MLVLMETSSAVLVVISSKSVSICNRSHARLVDRSRNLMLLYGGLVEPKGSKFMLLKYTVNAEN